MSGTLRRGLHIGAAGLRLALFALRWRRRDPARLPARLRDELVGLGTTFVKLGQGLSLRWDLLTPPWREALSSLHSHVPPFDAAAARASVEAAFGRPVDQLFAHFEDRPLAAASVAQIHAARLADGRDVVVKITRPGIQAQVHTDLRLLRRLVRIALVLWPPLRRQRPLDLVEELAQFLHAEIDMRHEAQNMRRMAAVIDIQPGVTLPHVVEPLATREVLVQERSHGTPLEGAFGSPAAPDLAYALLDAYVQQLFAAGVFHADPHPGNLFVLEDGRLCFHDFGSIGVLDPVARRALAAMVEAIAAGDAGAVLDAAIGMGFFGVHVERRAHEREIHAILAELASRPLAEWSVAEVIWRVARIGHGADFRLPAHLLVLMRTLFLVESTLRALDPNLDLLGRLQVHVPAIARTIARDRSTRRLAMQLMHGARQLPELAANWLRQAQLGDGRPAIAIHHRGLHSTQEAIARTGNRLALALVTLGLYLTGALLTLHSDGPRVLGHVPVLAAVAFTAAALLSLRLVFAISRSGHL
ncbi:MAG: ABC1 kinase family protein [Pseudomonadota bacterium]